MRNLLTRMHGLANRRLIGAAIALGALAGCATAADPRDPWEPVNRGIYRFNERVDKAVVRPVARAYRAVLPQFVRTSVSNVFSNVNDVKVCVNNALQGKFAAAYSDFGRIAINSTVGLLGLFDIATEAGIDRHNEDFGQTLGWWGVPDGPFMMLPIFGPSTVRDTGGWAVDIYTDPVSHVDPTRARNQLAAGRLINRRAQLLDAKKVLEAAALDSYQFTRDAYLQRRRNLVYDGDPPPEKDLTVPLPPDDAAADDPPTAAKARRTPEESTK